MQLRYWLSGQHSNHQLQPHRSHQKHTLTKRTRNHVQQPTPRLIAGRGGPQIEWQEYE